VAARLGRTVTIATALITALVGITATVSAAFFTYKTSAERLASETEKSATEFLRQQRQAVYTDFAAEGSAFYSALTDGNKHFPPNDPPPTLEDFNSVDGDVTGHFRKLAVDDLHLELVASEDVCDAAARVMVAFANAEDEHIGAAWPYVTGKNTPDDDYRKVWMTDKDIEALQVLSSVFIQAAREDLTDPELRKPAKNCPKSR
jgi:hypothetical protein